MELCGNDISAWAPNYCVLEALLQRVFIYFKQQTQSPPKHCNLKGKEVHFKHRISNSTACNPSFQLPFLHCLTLDSGDKPSVTCVARVLQTKNALCTVKWMSMCETVLARKSQQQTQHWRNAGRSCCNTELGWNYEYAIKKSGFFCVTELGWKGAKKYLWQKQCISWSGSGNALPCHAYAICLPYDFWMFNRL